MNLQERTPTMVFDLGGVLFDTDTRTMVYRASTLLKAPVTNEQVQLFFRELAQIKPIMHHAIPGRNESGHIYPPVLSDFLAGVTTKQILEHIAQSFDTKSHFWQLAQAIFNPEILVQLYTVIPQGEQFAKECAKQGYKLYVLSNWDIDSFPLVRKKHEKLFNLFSGILTSGECHLIKPDPAIYKLLLKQYELKPDNCFVVDNQAENIAAAQSLGMHGILCPEGNCGPNFDEVRKSFNSLLVQSNFKV